MYLKCPPSVTIVCYFQGGRRVVENQTLGKNMSRLEGLLTYSDNSRYITCVVIDFLSKV